MDRSGIERSFLVAVRCGDLRVRGSTEIPYEKVHAAVQRYPHRFSGLAGIDPTRGIAGLKELDKAVKEYGFVGAHLYPHWFGQAPDAAIYYPYYARCAELGIPIMMQVGHCLVYQKDRRLPSVGRPITLDQVAIDFPELTLIGIHLGYPWTEEMISVCTKHPNVYMAGDAYAPKHWGAAAVHFANTFGQDKFMFGTDWWVIDPERAVDEVHDLEFPRGIAAEDHARQCAAGVQHQDVDRASIRRRDDVKPSPCGHDKLSAPAPAAVRADGVRRADRYVLSGPAQRRSDDAAAARRGDPRGRRELSHRVRPGPVLAGAVCEIPRQRA